MGAPISAAVAARAARTFPPTVVEQLAAIEQDLGGRQQVVGLLLLAPLNADLEYLLGLLGDPKYHTQSLAGICAIANVLPGELLKLLGPAALLRGKLQAAQKIGQGIAAVAADVMRRAAPFTDACHACRGIGSVTPEPTKETPNPMPGPCETCQGVGTLQYQPTLDRQKLAIEMAQLLPKGGGMQIAVQQIAPGSGGDTSARRGRLQALTDTLLYGGPVIDTRALPEGADEPDGD